MQNQNRRLARLLGLSQIAFQQILRRTIFVCGGLCVGGAAVLMALLADKAQDGFRAIVAFEPLAAFILPPFGFALSAFMAQRFFPNSQGSGIPQVIAARDVSDPKQRLSLISLKVAAGKIILMTFALFCGASIGREGPTVQVGAAIMAAIGRKTALVYQSGLLLAGAAAGISAAFNTPLAGIVFGIEELSRSFEVKTSSLVIGCVIAAGITSLAILGDYTYFGSTAAVLPLGRSWLIVPLCASLGGLLGGTFSALILFFAKGLPGGSEVLSSATQLPLPSFAAPSSQSAALPPETIFSARAMNRRGPLCMERKCFHHLSCCINFLQPLRPRSAAFPAAFLRPRLPSAPGLEPIFIYCFKAFRSAPWRSSAWCLISPESSRPPSPPLSSLPK